MTRERLIWLIENWCDWMRIPANKLGFPSKSLCISNGGGTSPDEFEIMCERADEISARAMDAMVDSLRNPERIAINHHWLGVKHFYPTQEYDLEMAYSALMIMADRRGVV